jgi:hypothetical protein
MNSLFLNLGGMKAKFQVAELSGSGEMKSEGYFSINGENLFFSSDEDLCRFDPLLSVKEQEISVQVYEGKKGLPECYRDFLSVFVKVQEDRKPITVYMNREDAHSFLSEALKQSLCVK